VSFLVVLEEASLGRLFLVTSIPYLKGKSMGGILWFPVNDKV